MSSAVTSTTATASYRHLLRAIHVAFRGDAPLLTRARMDSRTAYEDARAIEDPQQADAKVRHAEEVAQVLRTQIVQGRRRDQTSEGMTTVAEDEQTVDHASNGKIYELRIHKDIELGDNETIRKNKRDPSSAASSSGGCCGGAAKP
ncbi:Mitochondrial zinc maintenance protein 1, mitochondrial [Savitreella phatthalungensis]